VFFIEIGNLQAILHACHGAVIVNSTTGLHSLRAGVPTIALGAAVFDVAGLTHQGGIDSFWRHPEKVDKDLLNDFIKALAGSVQIKGSFYHAEGRRLGAEGIIKRIREGLVNEPGAYVETPPRLAWRRLPLSHESRPQSAGLLDLAGKEILGTAPEGGLAVAGFTDVSDGRGRKLR
jgi:capsular polysaccharide export protein